MATVQVRMDERVKVKFDKLAEKINSQRAKLNMSKLNTAQMIELAVIALDESYKTNKSGQ